jgi:hypothetical protein
MKRLVQNFKGSGVLASGATNSSQSHNFIASVPMILLETRFSSLAYLNVAQTMVDSVIWLRCNNLIGYDSAAFENPAGVSREIMSGVKTGYETVIPMHYNISAGDNVQFLIYMKLASAAAADMTFIFGYSFTFLTPEDGIGFELQ